MYANDIYGDCTCAAAGHMIQNWTANAEAEVTPTKASVVEFYKQLVGTPGPEVGCNMNTVLKHWHHTGLGTDKILAYTQLEPANHVQAKDALYMFGTVSGYPSPPEHAVRRTHAGDQICRRRLRARRR